MSYLKKYDIELETLTPVFIGDGAQINKKEYAYDRRSNTAYIMNMQKLFNVLLEKNLLDRYEAFVYSAKNSDLLDFLRNVAKLSLPEVKEIAQSVMQLQDKSMQDYSIKNINTFVKDAYGLPYVPGTSLKGALRSILLSYALHKNPNKFVAISQDIKTAANNGISESRTKILKREVDDLENRVFRTMNRKDTRANDAVNDVLSGLIVSDSEPLNKESLTLCQKVDFNIKGEEKKLNMVRECIKPGEKIRFTITIDEKACSFTIEDINAAIKDFYRDYQEKFVQCFRNYPDVGVKDDLGIYLGGGAGFSTKTVVHSMYDAKKVRAKVISKIIESTLSPRIASQHHHERDEGLGVSPHVLKCTDVNGHLMQMGLCQWRVCD